MSKDSKFSIMKYDWMDNNGASECMYEVAKIDTALFIDDLKLDELKLLRDFLTDYITGEEKGGPQ